MRAVVGRIDDEGVLSDPHLIEIVKQRAHVFIVVYHRVVIWRLPAARLSQTLLLGMCEEMHVGEVHPDEERFAVIRAFLDEPLRLLSKVVVTRSHSLYVERSGILDLLFADPAPAWLHGRVVYVGCEAVDDAAGLTVSMKSANSSLGK